jgi:hypothetical protein
VRRRTAFALFAAALLSTERALADPGPVQITAERIELDSESQELVLRGDVELDAAPFHLTSPELRLSRSRRGIVVRGTGRIAFCPCLAQPLAITFHGATIAPPGDLLVDRPTLEVFHVPILALPFFWLRARDKVGLLAPTIAYRGQDGLFLGEGVHFPWKAGDLESGLDLQAGAYLKGGVATEATLRTPESVTTFRWDHLANGAGAESAAAAPAGSDASDGVAVDARGAMTSRGSLGQPSLAWDVDALRGERAVVSTTDVDAASRVFDRFSGEAALRGDGWTVSSGVRATNIRGDAIGELGAAGPVASLRRDGTVGDVGAYDARVEGGTLMGASLATTSFGRAAGGILLAAHAGPFRTTWSVRGVGDVATAGPLDGFDGGAQTRLAVALPVERAFRSSDPNDPYWHRIEPRVEVGALGAGSQGAVLDAPLLGFAPVPATSTATSNGASLPTLSGVAWVADGGVSSTFGRWGAREGLELRVSAGSAGSNQESASAVVRWRGAASFPWLGLGAEGAHVLGGEDPGYAFAARLRIGLLKSLHLGANVAARSGVDPVLARVLTDTPLPASMGFLAAEGWTGGARLSVPLTTYLTAGAGADVDLTAERLLAGRGSLEFHDRCGCVVIAANGAERLGRPGVDVWLTASLVQR